MDSWRKEFMNGSAYTAAKRGRKAALKWSLRMWEGLLKKNLKKHGLSHLENGSLAEWEDGAVVDSFRPDDSEDALCIRYAKAIDCKGCPVAEEYGNSCDHRDSNGCIAGSPWESFSDFEDARPMLRLLRKAAKKYGVNWP